MFRKFSLLFNSDFSFTIFNQKISIKISLITISALFILELVLYWTQHPEEILSLATLFSIAILLSVLFTMLLYAPLDVKTPVTGEINNGLSSYSENVSGAMFEYRSIALYIILSFITFGIFLLIWLINIVRDVHKRR